MFVFFLSVAFGVILLFNFGVFKGVGSFLEEKGMGFEGTVFSLFQPKPDTSKVQKVLEENEDLRQKLVDLEFLKKENKALSDQFKTGSPANYSLLPARVISAPSFIPGVTEPKTFVLDKGEKDGVKVNQAVVFKNNLVGMVDKVSNNRSIVKLLTSKNFSFPARTLETSALGVISGEKDEEVIFDNVVLSDELKVSDLVTTYGGGDIEGVWVPPDIIIGKIISIERKSSSLFQTAKVKSFLYFSKLFIVFVVVGE